MNYLFHNIRFYVLISTLFLSIVVFLNNREEIRWLVTTYALLAISYLYITLLIGPLTRLFIRIPLRNTLIKARRGLGVSAFYLALLHGFCASAYLGGITVIPQLGGEIVLPLSLGVTSLIILLLLAITSFDYIIQKLSFPKWKFLHRFVYVVELLIPFHMFLLGSDFADRNSLAATVTITGSLILILLQVAAFIQTRKKYAAVNS